MSGFDIARHLRFVPRSGWGASPRYPREGHKVARDRRTHVFIHHTVMVDRDDSPNIWETEAEIFAKMRSLQTARPDLGLDVPYSFVAFMTTLNDGLYICEGRGEDRSGAHSVGHNTASIGVSFAGDFENRPIADEEIAKRMPMLSAFLGWLKHSASHPDYGSYEPMKNLGSKRPKDRAVFVHQDIKATACPGAKLIPHLAEVAFVAPDSGTCAS